MKFSMKEKLKAKNCSDTSNRLYKLGIKMQSGWELEVSHPSEQWISEIGETNPMKTKQATDWGVCVNYITTSTWTGASESKGWILWPEGSFQAYFHWKKYLKSCIPSLMLWKILRSCHRIALCWVPCRFRWAIGWNLLVPLSESVTLAEMQHGNISSNSGQLV